MAKDLPFFKFYVSEWNDGKIVDCSMEAQGLFINLCSLYWSRLGALEVATAKRKLCARYATAYKELISAKIIKVSGDRMSVGFLDEQLDECKSLSEENRQRALKRWKKDATALPPHSEGIATAMQKREDKIRGEESESKTFGITHEHFIIIKSKYIHEPTIRINGKDGLIEYMEANQTVLNLPQFAEKYMRSAKGKVFNELTHLQNHYAKYVEKLHQ